jgi:hypothetical protein
VFRSGQARTAGRHPSSWADPTYHPTMFGGWGLGFRNSPRAVLDLTQGHGRARVLYGNSFVAPVSPQAPSVGYCSISRPPEEAPEQTRCGSMRRRSPAAGPAFVLFQFWEMYSNPVSRTPNVSRHIRQRPGPWRWMAFTSILFYRETVDRNLLIAGAKFWAQRSPPTQPHPGSRVLEQMPCPSGR